MDFASALREQIVTRKRRGPLVKRLLAIIDGKPSKRRTRILARLEAHARLHLVHEGMATATGAIDWGAIDWAKVFDFIMKLLLALLPLLL